MRFSTSASSKRPRLLRAFRWSGASLLALAATPALADSPHPNADANGVDLTDGTFSMQLPVASIGTGEAALPLIAYDGQRDNYSQIFASQSVSGSTTHIVINLGPRYDNFSSADGFAASSRGTGATLTLGSGGALVYRELDGTVTTFGNPAEVTGGASNLCDDFNNGACTRLALSRKSRSGMTINFGWQIHQNCELTVNPDDPADCTFSARLTSVTNSAGYSINWTFADNGTWFRQNPGPQWYRRTTAELRNGNVSAPSWPTVTYGNPSTNVYTITTPGNKTWRITGASQTITGIRRPGASADSTTVTYGTPLQVSSVTANGVTTSYNRTLSGSTATMVVTDAQSRTTTYVSDMNKYRTTSVTDALGKTTSMVYDAVGRLTEVTYPLGNKVVYGYDGRGNVTTQTFKARPSIGGTDIVLRANFPTTCTNVVTCNLPTWTRDGKSLQTDYEYDPATGQPTVTTEPLPITGSNRPQQRYTYTTVNGVSLLQTMSTCQTGAAPGCVGTADEVRTSYGYNSNLLPQTITTAAGNNTLSAVTTNGYDAIGNLITVDGPLAGVADTTTYRFNADRATVGVIAADPDGTGPLVRRATKIDYNAAALPETQAVGTVAGTSDANWSAFVSVSQAVTTYDTNARPTRLVASAGSTTYGITHFSYDTLGRPDCVATRMNNGAWWTSTAACTLQTAGAAGPDRISKTTYDELGRVKTVKNGLGTTTEETSYAATYTDNGRLWTVTDGENNRTTYEYDGFDRLWKTFYPLPTKGALASSTTDYEQKTYDANGNVTQQRLRDGQLINLTYNNLNQLRVKNLPGTDPDATYTFDLLGRMTQANQSGNVVSLTYDVLGRNKTQAGPHGTMSYDYDLAGRRTRVTWPDSFYVDYDYLVTGEVDKIRENGATSGVGVLASYTYDDLGRRTATTRGNGTSTGYSYDGMSRLLTFSQNLAGTADDLTVNGITYNPVDQIRTITRSNDVYAYAWAGRSNFNRPYTNNGLNQHTAAGAFNFSYDLRGNLTSDGARTFTYNSENRLLTGPSVTLGYDPLGRLYQITDARISPSVITRFAYDGMNLVGEYNQANALQRRYVHGVGADEPLVAYEGSGTSNRRWLHADERGSVIAHSDGSGTLQTRNTYDEFGIPGSGNSGRFQYTAQSYLSELGLYYYKARIYSPTIGRFLQTDPIGYGDGLNLYAYVANDSVNKSDPTGLCGTAICHPDLPVTGQPGGGFDWGFVNPIWWGGPGIDYGGGGIGLPMDGGSDDIIVTARQSKPRPAPRVGQPKQCFGAPSAPGIGVSRQDLMAQARLNGAEAAKRLWNPFNLVWFRSQVQAGGPWDYKQFNPVPGSGGGYENFGNYNYGYTGSAMGVRLDFLLQRAGIAQSQDGHPGDGGAPGPFGLFGGTPPYGDQIADQDMITRGWFDRYNGC